MKNDKQEGGGGTHGPPRTMFTFQFTISNFQSVNELKKLSESSYHFDNNLHSEPFDVRMFAI